MTDSDHQLSAVRAHSLLGSVAAVKGALDTILTHRLDESTRDSLLLMAKRRLDHLADELWQVAVGLPEYDDEIAAMVASGSAHDAES